MGAAEPSGPPGPASVEIPATMLQAMIDHARAEYPNEMCGVVVGDEPAADGGWKYLSAGTFTRDFSEMHDDLEGGVNWW